MDALCSIRRDLDSRVDLFDAVLWRTPTVDTPSDLWNKMASRSTDRPVVALVFEIGNAHNYR